MKASSTGQVTSVMLIAVSIAAMVFGALAMRVWQNRSNDPVAIPAGAVARLDAQTITLEQLTTRLEQASGQAAADVPLPERKAMLQQMVRERILHEHAASSGVLFRDERLREELRAAVARSLHDADTPPPTADELRHFYREHGAQFREPSRVALQQMIFRGSVARQQAELAYRRLTDGESFASVKAQLAGPDLVRLPEEPLNAADWQGILGTAVTQVVATLPSGHFTEPLAAEGGFAIYQVSETVPAQKPPLDSVRDAVLRALESQRRDALVDSRVDELLAALQARQAVQFNEALVESLTTSGSDE